MKRNIKQVSFSSVTRQFLPSYAFLKEQMDKSQQRRLEDLKHEKWIVDTDCGVDDASAVFVALHYFKVLAIIATSGNTGRQNVAKNVAKILQLKHIKVPIWKGAPKPLIQKIQPVPEWHGQDGLGDSEYAKTIEGYTEMIDTSHQESALDGVIKLVQLINQQPGQINILAIGPLSTLATAILLDRSICAKVKSVHIMGGNYKGIGNQGPNRPSVEYNFGADPEAAQIVIKSFPNIQLVPWEAVQQNRQLTIPYCKKNIFNAEYPCCKFLYEVNKDMIAKQDDNKFFLCDVVSAAVVVDSASIIQQSKKKGFVITDRNPRRGELIVEEGKQGEENIQVIQHFDTYKVAEILEVALKSDRIEKSG